VADSVSRVPKAAGRRPASDRRRPDPNDPVVQYVHGEGFPLETAIEMIYVQGHAESVADAARAACGERFCEVRIEHDGHILVTVRDLTDADDDALQEIGRECGIDGWVRARRADPAELLAWERCRHELVRLRTERPEALREYPGPDSDYQPSPFRIDLAPWAVDAAAELHEQLGAFVQLRVGALSYPLDPNMAVASSSDRPANPVADPTQLRIELDGPLSIASGHTARHRLLLTNLTDQAVTVHTNGQLTAHIADPKTSRAIGGYTGAQISPLILFTAAPGETVRIPLVVGTESCSAELGYAIPAGRWALFATLQLHDGRTLDTPLLPLTVTE
jgi:hypothetical protein